MDQTEQIIELLEDDSFPQVVLIDGAWGTGKTYFIRSHLLGSLDSKFGLPVFFFSLYGVSSVEDFRDKIISLLMTGTEDSSKLAKLTSRAIEGIATNMGEKGVGAMLSGAAGAYKYSLYNSLDDCILILDDLERVNDEKVIKSILGECLDLAESKNIKVIVVANEEKLTCKPDIEKVFADKFKFGFSHEDVVQIIREQYDDFGETLLQEIHRSITSLDSKNIRVIKRAISKFQKIRREIEGIDGVNLEVALSGVLSHIIRICVAKYEHGFSKEQIIYATTKRYVKKTDADESEEQIKVNSIFSSIQGNVSGRLISYCCDGIFDFDDLSVELNLPFQTTLLDKIQSEWWQYKLSDEELKEGLTLLENYIQNGSEVKVYDWFIACDAYINMLDKKIIQVNTFSIDGLISFCKGVDNTRFSTPLPSDFSNRRFRMEFKSTSLYEIFKDKEREVDSRAKECEHSDLSRRFEQSWDNVESEFYKKYMHEAIYQKIGVEVIKRSLLNWTNYELFKFLNLNKSRYEFSNLYDYFYDELETLKSLIKMLESMSSELGFGVKVVSIDELICCFADAVTLMETQHKNKMNREKKC
ncbi:P-loop NTPase fold protein [Vibrio crassostreae]|uniref:P-loop NTPase fold protein n=1 Tax=Vibrio crassostreae TaxID=246167 RepID=UPI0011B51133|nr:P-loop NTPase fold protein [Vibrio crassostreae]